jgi:hypothetical protein
VPRGLPSVEQKFTADVGGYVAGIEAMIEANQGLIESILAAERVIGGLSRDMAGLHDRDLTIRVRTVYEGGTPESTASRVADSFRQQMNAARDYEQVITRQRRRTSASMPSRRTR